MGFPCRRGVSCAVCAIFAALFSVSMIGCSSHERMETALASGAGMSFAGAQVPQYKMSVAPQAMHVIGDSADLPQRAISTPPMTKLSSADAPSDLRVMTFNLRVPFILDANNHWAFRKKNVIKTIAAATPDVLGVQECVAEQADYLREQLPAYGFRGVGRGDGRRQGEFAAILYRRDKFTEIDHGYFWLSETPDVPGSKSWGAWSTRMCTWIKLQPRDGSPAFAMFNAHLDNMSGRSRENSARLMHEKIVEITGGSPVIVTGDFNADAGTEPYRLLLAGEQEDKPQLLYDAFRVTHPRIQSDEGTRHDFNGKRGGDRIDWILCNTGFTPLAAHINRTRSFMGYPSDHFPVQVTLRPAQRNTKPLMARIE
jgi:endonuclease/exonuclease/phosphatase family metal-dependent hydrolase